MRITAQYICEERKLIMILQETLPKETKRRLSGILVHPTSFPSPYGIGDLGQGA